MSENTSKFNEGLPKKVKIDKNLVMVITSGVIAIVSAITIFLLSDTIGLGEYKNIVVILGVMIGIVPFTLLQIKEASRKDSVDKNMPMFLLALLSSVKTGASIEDGIGSCAKRNFGSLTPEIKNLNATLTWGFPISDCFKIFSERTGTKISRRVAILLEMAMRIGGDISENLGMIQKHVTEVMELEKGRKSALAPYVYTIYISFIVFLAISLLLTLNFVPEIEKVKKGFEENPDTKGGFQGGEMFTAIKNFDPQQLKDMMFNMAIIEGIFGGLAAGKISTGTYLGGVRHVVIMVVVTIISFTVV